MHIEKWKIWIKKEKWEGGVCRYNNYSNTWVYYLYNCLKYKY